MRCHLWLILTISLLLGIGKPALSQIACFTTKTSALENTVLELALHNSNQNLRRSNYSIAINAVIVHSENEASSFSKQHIDQLIENANLYFNKIGLQFYIQNQSIEEVYNSDLANFQIKDEVELRNSYEQLDAINIYFVKNISLEDGSKLNGLSSLPSLKAASNRLFFSYFDNNSEDFKTLKEKTFLHEFGHYFGLLHTFQDSNAEEIEKRELVIRGPGGNCITTGDQLCDTPSDPYGRENSLFLASCNDSYSEKLLDANGDQFSPLLDNIMSYHFRCGNIFTAQQYQRMEAALSIRLSPKAEYELSTQDSHFLSLKSLPKKYFCAGETVLLKSFKAGSFSDENNFSVEISDQFGDNFKTISAIFSNDSIFLALPSALQAGTNYRLMLRSSSPEIKSFPSENFEIRKEGEINITVANSPINRGEYGEIQVNMKGSGPWNFEFTNGIKYADVYENQVSLFVNPLEDVNYKLQSAWHECGVKIDTATVELKIAQANIQLLNAIPEYLCKNQTIQLLTKGLDFNNLGIYRILFEGNEENYLVKPNINAFSMDFIIPEELKLDKTYNFKIMGKGLGDFSLPIEIIIKGQPKEPETSTLSTYYCYGELANKLTATGENLKWFLNKTQIDPQTDLTPNTSMPGVYTYFVSQRSVYGCESEKTKVEITVEEKISASISGDAQIIAGESVELGFVLTGVGPWDLLLNDGTEITASTTNFKHSVSPPQTISYHVKEVRTVCGIGQTIGEANIEVIMVLANLEKEGKVNIYPNPTSNYVYIELKNPSRDLLKVYLHDSQGRMHWSEKIIPVNGKAKLALPRIHSGNYIISVQQGNDIFRKKLRINK